METKGFQKAIRSHFIRLLNSFRPVWFLCGRRRPAECGGGVLRPERCRWGLLVRRVQQQSAQRCAREKEPDLLRSQDLQHLSGLQARRRGSQMLHPQPAGAAPAGGDGDAAFSWKTEPIAQLQHADHLTGLEPAACPRLATFSRTVTSWQKNFGTVITYSCHCNPVFFSWNIKAVQAMVDGIHTATPWTPYQLHTSRYYFYYLSTVSL